MISHKDSFGLITHYDWKKFEDGHRVIHYSDNSGITYDFDYQLDKKMTQVTNHHGHSAEYHYNDDNRVIKYLDFDQQIFEYFYTDNGDFEKFILPSGLQFEFERDSLNRVLSSKETFYDAEKDQTDSRKQYFSYDGRSLRVSIYQNSEGKSWRTEYNEFGLVTLEEDALGHQTHYLYNDALDLESVIDAAKNNFEYKWNSQGLLTTKIDCSGNKTTYEYDRKDRLTSIINPLNQKSRYRYSKEDWLVQVIDQEDQTENFSYNSAGLLLTAEDKAKQITQHHYDELGRLIKVTDRLQRELCYAYNIDGNISKLTNQNGASYSFEYDEVGRIVRENRVDGTVLSYQYTQGQLSKISHIGRNNSARETDLTLNAWGELTEKTTATDRYHYQYNDMGALIGAHSVKLADPEATIHPLKFEYNANGQLIKEHSPDGTLEYHHDALGNMDEAILPSGNKIAYTRYGSGYVHSILWKGQALVDFEHNALHQEKLRTLGKRQLTTQYDSLNRVKSHCYDASPAHPLAQSVKPRQQDFIYNALDELIELTDSLKGKRFYHYDAEGRLLSHQKQSNDRTRQAHVENYIYDLCTRQKSNPSKYDLLAY